MGGMGRRGVLKERYKAIEKKNYNFPLAGIDIDLEIFILWIVACLFCF